MAKKHPEGYLSPKESRRISKENRRITDQYEKQRKRKNVPEREYLTQMHDPNNAVEFDNLHTYFFTDSGVVKSVDGVTFNVPIGKTVGVVGESGCGKSVTSLSLMQLIQRPQGQIVEGELRLNLGEGKAYDIVKTPQQQMQRLRGNYMSMIFQEPMTSLNPVFRIGDQVDEVIALHDGEGKSKGEVKARTIALLELVGIANSEGVYRMFPHELSGGMRQRVMIAMALACSPKIIIADEPTTALDVTVQARVLELLRELQGSLNTAILLITHNLGVVWEMCDDVMVMYAGQTVEKADTKELYAEPLHPYTWGLLDSIPKLSDESKGMLNTIPGVPPDLRLTGQCCNFCNRCRYAQDVCRSSVPPLVEVKPNHFVACHLQNGTNRLERVMSDNQPANATAREAE